MTQLGIFLSSEEHGPKTLVDHARQAAEVGLNSVFISDHFHPWLDSQGQSPFVWSVIGAIAATTDQDVMTGVTCPIVRIHPAVIAQAAATSQLLLDGKFVLGLGTGEALNEHITGARWPAVDERLEMLEESIEILRALFTGHLVNHRGRHYTVQNARLYSCPDSPPPIYISAFGEKSLALASRVGDGLVTTRDQPETIARFRATSGGAPVVGALKLCWGEDADKAAALVCDRWPTTALEGQLSQELPMPAHFAQAAAWVTPDHVRDLVPCGPDPEVHTKVIEEYLEAGFDRLYLNQIGPDAAGFLHFFDREIRPRLSL